MLLKTRAMIFFTQYLLQVCYYHYDELLKKRVFGYKNNSLRRRLYANNDGKSSTLKFLIL